MKKILTGATLLLLIAFNARSQSLANHIPDNVFAVASVKGNHLTQLVPIANFDHSFLGQKLLNGMAENRTKPFDSLEDFGVNLNETSYYFSVLTDSINYNCYLIPLADVVAFSEFLSTDTALVKADDTPNTFFLKDSSALITWDNEKMLYIDGKVNYTFLDKPENAERYGIIKLIMPYYDKYGDNSDVIVDTITNDSVAMYEVPDNDNVIVEQAPTPYEAPDTDSTDEKNEELDDYYKRYDANNAIKKKLQVAWIKKKCEYILGDNFKPITNNASYVKSINNKAVASLWVSDLKTVYSNLMSGLAMYKNLNAFTGFGQLNLDLFLDEEKMRIESKMTLDDSMADSYKKMMNQKINRKFFKYVDSEKVIGFAGYAINTKAYLQEFPKFVSRTYGTLLGENYADLADLGSDLFSLIIDEEAIGKVVNGDALFVINGVTKKHVNYTSYDYDDDYKRIEVEKTKTETLPSFLMMFSSDDYKMLAKLLNLNSAKNYVSYNGSYYTLSYRKSPFDFYVMMKGNMVFVGNNLEDFNQISNNNYKASISKKHKKILKKSNFSLVVNPKILAKEVPFNELAGKKEGSLVKSTFSEMNDIYIKSSRIKGNIVSGEMVAEIPDGQKNALQYIFSLIEKVSDL